MRMSARRILSRIGLPYRFSLTIPEAVPIPLAQPGAMAAIVSSHPGVGFPPHDLCRTPFARIMHPQDDASLPFILHYLIAHQAAGCKSWATKKALRLAV